MSLAAIFRQHVILNSWSVLVLWSRNETLVEVRGLVLYSQICMIKYNRAKRHLNPTLAAKPAVF